MAIDFETFFGSLTRPARKLHPAAEQLAARLSRARPEGAASGAHGITQSLSQKHVAETQRRLLRFRRLGPHWCEALAPRGSRPPLSIADRPAELGATGADLAFHTRQDRTRCNSASLRRSSRPSSAASRTRPACVRRPACKSSGVLRYSANAAVEFFQRPKSWSRPRIVWRHGPFRWAVSGKSVHGLVGLAVVMKFDCRHSSSERAASSSRWL